MPGRSRNGGRADDLSCGFVDDLGHCLVNRLGNPLGNQGALVVVVTMGVPAVSVMVSMGLGDGNRSQKAESKSGRLHGD